MRFLRLWCVVFFIGALAVFAPLFPARAEGTFIAAPGCSDFVHDPARGLIYIASGSRVLRYRVATAAFETPVVVGGSLVGMDLSPDGQTLAVANNAASGESGSVILIALDSLAVTPVTFARQGGEGGTWTVAWADDGRVYSSSSYNGSGWVPLRATDPASALTSVIIPDWPGVRQNTMLSASGDRSTIAFAESNASDGPWGLVRGGGSEVVRREWYENGTSASNYEIATNSNGSQFGIPTYKGTYIYDSAYKRIKILGTYAGEQGVGIAYHPTQNRIYLPWANTSQVRVFDSTNFTQVGAYDFENPWQSNGNRAFVSGRTKVSRDGSLLGATVTGGVRYVNLNSDAPRPLLAHGANIDLDEDTSATFDLGYSGGTPGVATQFAILSAPQRGTFTGQGVTRTYTPAPDANGSDEFSFRVTQGAATSTARVFITIRAINDAPVVANISAITRKERSVPIKAIATDVDKSYNSFDWRVSTPPAHGTAVLQSSWDGLFTYTPEAGFVGTDTFQIIANDGPSTGSFNNRADALDSAPATVTVTVSDNGAPVANPDSYSVSASEQFSVPAPGVLANDTDPEGDALTAIIDPNNWISSGSINLKPDGSFTWSPNYWSTQPAQITFRYAARDAVGAGDWTTVTLNLTPPLRANAQSISVPEDGSKALTLTGSGPGVLTYSVVTPPTKGLLSGIAPNLIYTPFANYYNGDSFVFAVKNDAGKSATATVSIEVVPAADIPVAFDGEADIEGDTATTLWLRAFDGDDNGLAFTIVNNPAHGTLTPAQIPGSGNTKAYVYRAESGYVGDDSLSFRVYDGFYTSNTATVRLHVRAPGNGAAPVAVADAYSVARGQTLRVSAPGILLNDSDAGGAPLRAILDQGPKYSALFDFNADGSFRYAGGVFPWQGSYASDSFTYHVSNGARNSASVTVTINVAPIAATPGALTLEANSSAAIALDASGPRPLNYLVVAPAHGVLSGNAPDLTYTPTTDYWGEDSFTFRAQNGDLTSTPATIAIRVLAPWSVSDSAVTARAGAATPFQLNISDPGARAVLSIETPPAHGTLSGTAPNLVYTANADYVGADSLVFAATVGQTRRTATVTFDVTPNNRAPVATPQSVAVDQNDELAIKLAGTDADGDALTFAVERAPAHGTLSGEAPNLIYTPNAAYFGSDSFGFTVSDGALTGRADVSIRVAYVSSAPVARADAYETLEDQPLAVAAPGVLSNDSDANGDALTAVLRSQPEHGQITLNANGSFNYRPDAGYFGDDGLNYAAFDGTLRSLDARVSIRVIHVNHAPAATPQSVATDMNVPLAITLAGTDPDGDALTFEIVAAPQNGTLSGTGGARTFTPATNFVGATSFSFRVVDAAGLASPAATVNIAVNKVNRAPVATPQSATTLEDNSKALVLRGSDPDGDALQFEISGAPQHGVLSGSGANRVYQPDADYFGADSFSFLTRDSDGLASAPAIVTLTIVPVNDAPSFGLAGSQITARKNAGTQTTPNFARQISPGNAYENEQTLAFSVSNSNGSLWSSAPQISPDGTLTFAPGRGKTGTVTVTVTLRETAAPPMAEAMRRARARSR